nr:hypothetical protein [Tanacetum cinerariifolium]
MVIDKSWTGLGKHEKEFYTGLKKFVDDCKSLVDSVGNIRCPCKSCRLVLWVSIKHLSDHISKYGFDPSYKTWIHHGEPDLPPPPPVIDNTRQPQMSDMTTCLNDLSYIPLNNEQNKPTQGDIDETSNDLTQAKRNEFEELYASANKELYPGCDYVTRLDFMAKFTYLKAKEPRNVRLGLAADGFNPFGNLSQSYSMWSVILTTYNLPPWLCIKESSFMLMLLIPGPKSSGKDIDVYLRPLIDDLKDLWPKPGVETIDTPPRQDKTKARQDLKRLGIRSGLWLGQNKNQKVLEASGCVFFHTKGQKKVLLQQYLAPDVAKPLIELCLFFKQICSQTLMVDDMFKAQSKAIFDGPIRPRWMYLFERYMKKLKNYVRNKAKPEGSIAEGYVAEKALTFSSHYFRDVTTKFNRPDRNVDCPSPTPEIDTYQAKFKTEFPNKYMKEEFPGWFRKQIRQHHVDNDPGVNESSELFILTCGPSQTPISVNSCVVNGVRFAVHSRDERRTTQNSVICSPGPDGEMYYGQLEQILEFSYLSFKTVLFRVKWSDTSNKERI